VDEKERNAGGDETDGVIKRPEVNPHTIVTEKIAAPGFEHA
jgi:hypothetical protein